MAQQWNDDSSSSDTEEVGNVLVAAMHDNFQRRVDLVAEYANERKHGGTSARRTIILNDRVGAHERLMNDYFANPPLYPPSYFRDRFRMRRELFIRIMEGIVNYDDYFKQKRDATGKLGFSSEVKMTAALRILANGSAADMNDDYLKISETTSLEAGKRFCYAINAVFGREYLRQPTSADLQRLLSKAEARGFPGMLGSLDCMHWEWKNCPVAWHGQYTNHHGRPTIILEAVASYDTWIWHAHFGPPSSLNDLAVLFRSPLFNRVIEGRAPSVRYTINGIEHTEGYYLADGIYPKWSTIVQSIRDPQGRDRQLFCRLQEAYRKDIERTFGILQAQFQIVTRPARQWYQEDITATMKACIIMHNMIVEDDRVQYGDDFVDNPTRYQVEEAVIHPDKDPYTLGEYMSNREDMENRVAHYALRDNLIQHVWEKYRNGHISI